MRQKTEKLFKNKEDVISMFLGLAVVAVLVLILINFIERRKGTISLPGIKDENKSEEVTKLEDIKNQVDTVVVVKGDSLWKIAVKVYGDGYKWTEIWKENKSVLKSPNRLEIGMKLIVHDRI